MSPITRTAARWGLCIGLVNLVWLYVAYYLGLHTSGVMVFQVFMLVWFSLTVAGFIFALRAVRRQNPGLSYWRGLAAGTVAATVSAIVAVIAQVGYFTLVHPEWPDVMAEQTRAHFTAEGMAADQIQKMVLQSREWFSLSNYAVSSAVTALVVGVGLSAIIMLFLRNRAGTPAEIAPTA
jgi:hypothetical protein